MNMVLRSIPSIMIRFKLAGLLLFVLILFEMEFCCGRRTRQSGNMLEDFDVESSLPRFSQPIPNVTVTIGKDALLPCVVDNLRSYKVAWVRVDTQTILTIHQAVITRNPRITLSYSDHRSWFLQPEVQSMLSTLLPNFNMEYLQIKNTQESDRGWYMCQVNTDPMRSLMGYLEVVVPPQIIDQDTSLDLVAKEGSNVTLHCKAKGHPEPYVMWRREDNQEIHYNGNMVNVIDGEVFPIIKISRLHMGAYLCIASNGIPPSISKRVEVKVQFPPMMTIPHQLEGAYLGQDITIECQTEAHPKSINYWTTEKGDMIVSGDKYESFLVDTSYRMYMRLKIRNLTLADFGTFKCVAKNSLGETDGNIRLYEIATPPTTLATTVRTTPFPSKKPKKTKRPSTNDVLNTNNAGYDGQVSVKDAESDDNYSDLDNIEMSSSSGGSSSSEFFLTATTAAMLPWLSSIGLGLSCLWTSLQDRIQIEIFQLDQSWVKPLPPPPVPWKKYGPGPGPGPASARQIEIPNPDSFPPYSYNTHPPQSPSSVHIDIASASRSSARAIIGAIGKETEICSTSTSSRSDCGSSSNICNPRSKNNKEREREKEKDVECSSFRRTTTTTSATRRTRTRTSVSHDDKEVKKNPMSTDDWEDEYVNNFYHVYRYSLGCPPKPLFHLHEYGYGSGINLMCLSLTLILIHFH